MYETSITHAYHALEMLKLIAIEFQPPLGSADRLYRKKCIGMRDACLPAFLQVTIAIAIIVVVPVQFRFILNC
jgi:hypothetical protein